MPVGQQADDIPAIQEILTTESLLAAFLKPVGMVFSHMNNWHHG